MLCHPAQKRDDFICQYCGKDGLASLDDWHDSTIDHVQPVSHGGERKLDNEVACCSHCNSIKGERVFASIAEAREYIRKRRAERQKEYENVYAEIRGGKPADPLESVAANFHAVDFSSDADDLPGPGERQVYVLCWKSGGTEVPFYVGETNRLRGRMGDYQSAQFAACTDFRVGEAIRYLRDRRGLRIVLRYRETVDPRKDESALIRDLQLSGLRLLNSLPSYNYQEADKDEERRTVQRFCEMLLANEPL